LTVKAIWIKNRQNANNSVEIPNIADNINMDALFLIKAIICRNIMDFIKLRQAMAVEEFCGTVSVLVAFVKNITYIQVERSFLKVVFHHAGSRKYETA
jgi:hypothetical protein